MRTGSHAVEFGDGWMPFPSPAKLAPHLPCESRAESLERGRYFGRDVIGKLA